MNRIISWIAHLGISFSPEAYLVLTRIQATMWTLADFVIVLMLLRIGNLIREHRQERRHRASHALLTLTVPFALFLPIAPTGAAIFRLELLVTIPHFLLILYVLAVDTPRAFDTLRTLENGRTQKDGSEPYNLPDTP